MTACPNCGAPDQAGPVCSSCGRTITTAAAAPAASTGPVTTGRAVSAIPTWEIVILAAAAVALIGSFLDFYKLDHSIPGIDTGWSAWSNSFSLFPAVTLAVLGIVVVGVVAALVRFAPQVKLPDQIARDWVAISTLIVVLSALTIIAFAIRGLPDGFSRGIGAWLTLIAAVAAIVAVVLRGGGRALGEVQAAGVTGARTLQPFGIVVIVGAAVALLGSFLDFVGAGSQGISAWSGDGGIPAWTLPALVAVACAVLVALDQLGTLNGGTMFLGVPLSRWARALGIDAGALMICYLIGDAGASGSADKKIGFWLMLLGSLAVAVAVVMGPRLQFNTGTSRTSSAP
jgi:hypothetical protein